MGNGIKAWANNMVMKDLERAWGTAAGSAYVPMYFVIAVAAALDAKTHQSMKGFEA